MPQTQNKVSLLKELKNSLRNQNTSSAAHTTCLWSRSFLSWLAALYKSTFLVRVLSACALPIPLLSTLATSSWLYLSFSWGFYFLRFSFFLISTAEVCIFYYPFQMTGHLVWLFIFFKHFISLFNLLFLKLFLLTSTMISINDLLPVQWFYFLFYLTYPKHSPLLTTPSFFG